MVNNVQQQDIVKALATSDFFQLLSLSLRLPTIELSKALIDGSYKHDGISILEELSCKPEVILPVVEALEGVRGAQEAAKSLLTELRCEHTLLFDDPKQPVLDIYESLFLNNLEEKKQEVMLFMSPAALDAERCYGEAGVSLISQSREPADHMATELEFMMYLYAKKGKALQEGDRDQLEKIEQRVQHFKESHLDKWCLEFFEVLQRLSTGAYYQGLACLAKAGLGQVSES